LTDKPTIASANASVASGQQFRSSCLPLNWPDRFGRRNIALDFGCLCRLFKLYRLRRCERFKLSLRALLAFLAL
jgi:hypothetical protein